MLRLNTLCYNNFRECGYVKKGRMINISKKQPFSVLRFYKCCRELCYEISIFIS